MYDISCPSSIVYIVPNDQSSPEGHASVWKKGQFLQWGVVSTLPNPQAGGPLPVGRSWLLIHYIHSFPPYWRSFLYPQPVDLSCCGDRGPLFMAHACTQSYNSANVLVLVVIFSWLVRTFHGDSVQSKSSRHFQLHQTLFAWRYNNLYCDWPHTRHSP
jgi:hypothetical protein